MSGTRWFVGLCAVISLQGCVTGPLWDRTEQDWRPPPPAFAQRILEAVRAGDGSHHIRVLKSDLSEQAYVIEGPHRALELERDTAAVGSRAWPSTAAAVARPRADYLGVPPAGVPVAVADPRPRPRA